MLEVKGLSKHFTTTSILDRLRRRPPRITRAVDDVSISFGRGEILGLVGESGSGKTTLARTILRLCRADRGEVWFENRNIFEVNSSEMKVLRSRLQIMFQDAGTALDPRYTARQCLEEPLLVHGFPEGDRKALIEKAMERTKFPSSLLDRRPVEMSGGQRQRLSLARTLVLEPEFIALDEPLAGLDPSIKAQVLRLLLELRDEMRLTYLLISHDLDTTLYAADRVAVMFQGRLVELFDPQAGAEASLHPYTRHLLGLEGRASPRDGPFSSTTDPQQQRSSNRPVNACPFQTWCPIATEECRRVVPQLTPVGSSQSVACHQVAVSVRTPRFKSQVFA